MDLMKLKNRETITSLEVAELTGKRHDVVLRDIRNILEQGCAVHNFGEGYYKDKQGQKRPMFNLNKKGALILASGYNAKLREKIIDRWQELENHVVARFIGKKIRVDLTDTIQESGINDKMHGFAYSQFTKLVYKKAGVEYVKKDNFRDSLTEEQLKKVEALEGIIKGYIELGLDYQQIKHALPDTELK